MTNVVLPERIPGGEEHIDPEHLARDDEHRPAAAASAHDLDGPGRYVDLLSAPEYEGGNRGLEHPDRTGGLGRQRPGVRCRRRLVESLDGPAQADNVAGWR